MKIVSEGKKIRNFVEENRLEAEFIEKLRNYKNLVKILLYFRESVLIIKFKSLFTKSN
jgi:hypothetical protein